MTPNRKLVYDFHELPHIRKIDVMKKLGLITSEEIETLKEQELWLLGFKTASARGLVEELRESVAKHRGEWK